MLLKWKEESLNNRGKLGEHGLRRAVRRGLINVAIQAYLTAAVINFKRLAAFSGLFFIRLRIEMRYRNDFSSTGLIYSRILLTRKKDFIILSKAA